MNTKTSCATKVMNYARKHWFFTLMLVSGLAILAIHSVYKMPAPCDFLESEWGAGDVLSYVGSIIGAVATIYVLQETIRFTISMQREEHIASIRPYFVMNATLPDSQSIDGTKGEQEIKLIGLSNSMVLQGSLSIILHLQNVGVGNAIVEEIEFSRIDSKSEKSVFNILPAIVVGEKYYIKISCEPQTLYFRMKFTDMEGISRYFAETKISLTLNAGRTFLRIDPLIISKEVQKQDCLERGNKNETHRSDCG